MKEIIMDRYERRRRGHYVKREPRNPITELIVRIGRDAVLFLLAAILVATIARMVGPFADWLNFEPLFSPLFRQ